MGGMALRRAEQASAAIGPWDHALARCRLLVAGDILRRDRLKAGRDLPPMLPEDWTFSAEIPERRAPPTAREIDLKDRTLKVVDDFAPTERTILMGMALGRGAGSIALELAKRSKSQDVVAQPERTVRRRMHHLALLMARRLNRLGEPVDEDTAERLRKELEREIDRN